MNAQTNLYHTPALVDETLAYIQPHADGTYVDCTVGGGGHSLAMLQKAPQIRLFCLDRDDDALRYSKKRLCGYQKQTTFIKGNFKNLKTELALQKINKVDGILMDIGVSNHQITTPERGFSFTVDAPLDMRMDTSTTLTAEHVVNTYSYKDLITIFYLYGEEINSKAIAEKIIKERENTPIKTTLQLAKIIDLSAPCYAKKQSIKSKARIFQAIRIEVNNELSALTQGLKDAISLLKPTARLLVISWHSLEDRIVKTTFTEKEGTCICPPELPICYCHPQTRLRTLTKKPITPTPTEIAQNPNAKSAKLRIAEKL